MNGALGINLTRIIFIVYLLCCHGFEVTEIWNKRTGLCPGWQCYTGPILSDQGDVLSLLENGNGIVVLSQLSGVERCRIEVPSPVLSTMIYDSGLVIFSTANTIHGWKLCSKSITWTFRPKQTFYFGLSSGGQGVALTLAGDSGNATAYAINVKTGAVFWKQQQTSTQIAFPGTGCGYVWTVDSHRAGLTARNPISGVSVFSIPLKVPPTVLSAQFSFKCAEKHSAIDVFYSCVDDSRGLLSYGLCAAGSVHWNFFPYRQNWKPAVYTIYDEQTDTVFGTAADYTVRAFNPRNGSVQWSNMGGVYVDLPLVPTTGSLKSYVITNGLMGNLAAFGPTGETLWSYYSNQLVQTLALNQSSSTVFLVHKNVSSSTDINISAWHMSPKDPAPQPRAHIVLRVDNTYTNCEPKSTKAVTIQPGCQPALHNPGEWAVALCIGLNGVRFNYFNNSECTGAARSVLFNYGECREMAWGSWQLDTCDSNAHSVPVEFHMD
eukprot:m.69192 g.69192  ORF g.69192 m.69192 type:complete len:491 (+) comp16018_c0_seq1:61-1533(+)